MSNLTIEPGRPAHPGPSTHPGLHAAPADSAERLRQFVGLAADLAFETDAAGRFVFLMPDDALGWPQGSLLGQPASVLIGRDSMTEAVPNPFCSPVAVTRRHVWLRRFDGTPVLMALSAAPATDARGQPSGARGVAIDLHNIECREPHFARRLRRMEVLDLLLERVSRERSVETMMDASLASLLHALGAEGAAIFGMLGPEGETGVLHECGPGVTAVGDTALVMLADPHGPRFNKSPDGRLLALAGRLPRTGADDAGLVIWRAANGLPWTGDDIDLAAAATGLIRIILDYEAVQQDMAHQARADPLTGLMNRRVFMEDLKRHILRLDREQAPGTMIFIDLDGFKLVNDQCGHATGDRILVQVADRLRALVRPNDLVARLGGDKFAVWLSGADHMTAAERADALCRLLPGELQAKLPDPSIRTGLSIGIATRLPGSREAGEEVLRRADWAMYEVKRSGRGFWRVSPENQV